MGSVLLRCSFMPRHASEGDSEPNVTSTETFGTSFRRGLFVGLSNPKMVAFFLGLFAPVTNDAMPPIMNLLVLGRLILIDLIYHQTLARVSAAGRGVIHETGKSFEVLIGGCMVAFGCGLIIRA